MDAPVLLMTNAELAEAIDYAFAAIHKTASQEERRKLMTEHLAKLLDLQVQRAGMLAERAQAVGHE